MKLKQLLHLEGSYTYAHDRYYVPFARHACEVIAGTACKTYSMLGTCARAVKAIVYVAPKPVGKIVLEGAVTL